MEQKFYTDSFEQLLRETTDEFRMYPNRKVWHSIYNDIHPSRKWPSASVLLLFIVSLLYISGYHVQKPFAKKIAEGNLPATPDLVTATSVSGGVNDVPFYTASPVPAISIGETPGERIQSTASQPALTLASQVINAYSEGASSSIMVSPSVTSFFEEKQQGISLEPGADEFNETKTALKIKDLTSVKDLQEDDEDPNKWMQEDIFYNKKSRSSKWKNVSYQLYGTPSFGFRSLKRKDAVPVAAASLVANPEAPVHENVNHDLAMNFEVGANALVRYSRNLRLKAGLQFNFTNYRIRAYELNHPSTATLTLNSLGSDQPTYQPYATVLANTPGLYSTVLDNYTLQLSVPVGADYRIAGKKNIQWYAGASIQPTLITNGNAYLLSSDMNHYVNDNNLLRRFNINGSVETFISFKTRNGVTLNAGPQVRYQFLSTYSNQYNYTEKLYNIGLKLGVTTNF